MTLLSVLPETKPSSVDLSRIRSLDGRHVPAALAGSGFLRIGRGSADGEMILVENQATSVLSATTVVSWGNVGGARKFGSERPSPSIRYSTLSVAAGLPPAEWSCRRPCPRGPSTRK